MCCTAQAQFAKKILHLDSVVSKWQRFSYDAFRDSLSVYNISYDESSGENKKGETVLRLTVSDAYMCGERVGECVFAFKQKKSEKYSKSSYLLFAFILDGVNNAEVALQSFRKCHAYLVAQLGKANEQAKSVAKINDETDAELFVGAIESGKETVLTRWLLKNPIKRDVTLFISTQGMLQLMCIES